MTARIRPLRARTPACAPQCTSGRMLEDPENVQDRFQIGQRETPPCGSRSASRSVFEISERHHASRRVKKRRWTSRARMRPKISPMFTITRLVRDAAHQRHPQRNGDTRDQAKKWRHGASPMLPRPCRHSGFLDQQTRAKFLASTSDSRPHSGKWRSFVMTWLPLDPVASSTGKYVSPLLGDQLDPLRGQGSTPGSTA